MIGCHKLNIIIILTVIRIKFQYEYIFDDRCEGYRNTKWRYLCNDETFALFISFMFLKFIIIESNLKYCS